MFGFKCECEKLGPDGSLMDGKRAIRNRFGNGVPAFFCKNFYAYDYFLMGKK